MLLYAKIIGIAVLLALIAGIAFHLGSLAPKAALANYKATEEAQHVVQLNAVTATLEKQIQQSDNDHAVMQGVIDAYDAKKDAPGAGVAGLAQRLYDNKAATASTGCPAVPKAGAVAGGGQAPGKVTGSDESALGLYRRKRAELTQAVFDAADADAKQLNTLITLAP